ncbi:MAG: pyridoxamine 5-phosphate oxidase [Oscillospiraceae bacterium]|nr:pyridoxamine 5-phosphate oxidase [Oscillospiraceae bacterium]
MDARERVLKFLKEAGAFYVATVAEDAPKVRPHSFVMEHNGRLCFTTNNQKPTYQQLSGNPKVEICALGKNGVWMRLHGTARFCTSIESKTAALDTMPSLKQMYSVEDDLLEVFCLENAIADFCSMFAGTESVTF